MEFSQLGVIREEINSKPDLYQQHIEIGNDEAIAAELNRPQNDLLVYRGFTLTSELRELFVYDEVEALPQRAWEALNELLKVERLDLSKENVRRTLDSIFKDAPVTLAALTAFYTRPGSFLEWQFGAGTFVTYSDIGSLYSPERHAAMTERELRSAEEAAAQKQVEADSALAAKDPDAEHKVKLAEAAQELLALRQDEAAKYLDAAIEHGNKLDEGLAKRRLEDANRR